MDNNKKYICNLCNYFTDFPSEWLKHLETQKHLRNGKKKPTTCDLCNYETSSHWNIKLHKLSQHATVIERQQHKYYCNLCDQVFFSKLYYDKHMNGKKHFNMVKVSKLNIQEPNTNL
jgi:hypothetical protein